MIQLINNKLEEICQICSRNHVRSLTLTGSALSERWNPETSDIDFIVEFQSMNSRDHAELFFRLIEELEALLGYPVDLIEITAVTNPYLRESFSSSQECLYALA